MNDCPNGEVRDLLPDLVHDRLDPATRREVDAHVATCADCREEIALLRNMSAMMHRAPAMNAAAIAGVVAPYRAPARRSWGGWRVAAAITVLAIGGSSVALLQRGVSHGGAGNGAVVAVAPTATNASTIMDSALSSSAPASSAAQTGAPTSARSGELALASSAIGDLDERELSTLLRDIESLDVVPSVDVDGGVVTISPSAPRGSL